jgi:GrpB-like predicted nucleotidyltransferase (UPF0157 family)
MLTEGQKKYLSKLSSEKADNIISIKPYDPKTSALADKIISKIKDEIPDVDVRFMGASALEISGQNDIDIYVITSGKNKETYKNILNKIFPELSGNINTLVNFHKWNWEDKGLEVSVYLSNPEEQKFQEQLDIFDLLKSNQNILKEYENLKLSMNGKTYKEYQTAKYEFYNRVLGIN